MFQIVSHLSVCHYFEIDSFKESEQTICKNTKLITCLLTHLLPSGMGLPCGTYLFRSLCWAFTGYSSLLSIIWEEKEGRGFFMPYRRIHLFERVSGVDRNILNNAYFSQCVCLWPTNGSDRSLILKGKILEFMSNTDSSNTLGNPLSL